MIHTSATTRIRVPNGDTYENDLIPEVTGTSLICIPEITYQTKLTRYNDPGRISDVLADTEVDLDHLTERLTDLGEKIAVVLRSTSSNYLDERLAEWCDMHGFTTIEDPSTRTVIARQAALAFLLRSTLYEKYHRRGALPPLSSNIRTGLELADEWIGELEVGWCVLDDLVHCVDQGDLNPVFEARSRLVESTQPAEDIGRLYEKLLSAESRQALGQFRTPSEVAEFMQACGVQNGDSILDPGIGAGALSAPCHPQWELSTDHDQVVGIDRSPLSLLIAETALKLYGQDHTVQLADFLALTGQEIPQVDSVICNPPYTSVSELPSKYKATIRTRLEESEVSLPGKAPLYAYFLVHAATLLDDGDRCVLLIPSAWMTTKYGADIKRFLLDHYRIKAVVGTTTEQFIKEAAVETVILLLDRTTDEARREENVVSFATLTETLGRIKQQRGFDHVASMLSHDEPPASSPVEILPRQQNELHPCDDWSQYIRAAETDIEDLHGQLTLELRDLAEVNTGLTSGCNAAFYFSDQEAAQTSIESEYLEPLIKSPTDCETYRITESDVKRRVLAVTAQRRDLYGTAAEEYLEIQEAQDVDERPALANKPGAWYVQEIRTAPLLHPYTVAQRHFCCVNETAACVDKRLVCIDPHDDSDTDLLFAFLNSTVGVFLKELHGTVRANGGLGTTVTTMKELPVLDPSQFTTEQRRALRAAAEQLKSESIRSIYTELGTEDPANVSIDAIHSTRRAIDTVIMSDVLGLSRQTQLQLYRDVCRLVTNRVECP